MGITHLSGLEVAGVPTQGVAGTPLFTGNWYFCDYANGNDAATGAADDPLQTIYAAYAKMISGNNDVAVIVGNGASTGSQRLSTAIAQTIDPTATTGTLTWAKNACHIIGQASLTRTAGRARFAPPTGTYTQATFGSGNFVVVTATGCHFQNFSLFNGFSTGGTNQICWTDSGGRNSYVNVDFGGLADAASAADTGSRSLKVSGSTGENTFVNCTVGLDTVTRGVANASLEFASGTPRNTFVNCVFPMSASVAGVLSILGTGASCMDRYQLFDRCWFLNAMSSGATAQTVIASLTNASPGGYMMMDNCAFVGDASTNWGDTNALANMYVMGATPTAASNGISVKPT